MIKAVLFDYGGVISTGGAVGSVRDIFAKAYAVDPASLQFDEMGFKAMKGLVSDQDFLDSMNRRHPEYPPVAMAQFVAACDELLPAPKMLNLLTKLQSHGIQTGVLSNTMRVSADINRSRGHYDLFNVVLLSCDEHAAKPEPEFYQLAIERLGYKAEEILFVDDRDTFLPPATKLGMRTLLAKSSEQIAADVTLLLQKENNLSL